MSSMMMEVSIGWHAIVVGDERPRHFQRAVQNLSQGWMPSGSSHGHHSIDIVLGLEQEVRLTRLEQTVLGWTENVPKVDVKLGKSHGFLPLDYKQAKRAHYLDVGTIQFPSAAAALTVGTEDGRWSRKFRRGRLELGGWRDLRRYRFVWMVLHWPAGVGKQMTFAVTDLKIFGLQQQQQSTDFAKRRRMRRLFGDLAFDGKDSDTSDMSHSEVGEEDSESDEV